jgi:hypothetical protein
MLQAMQFLLLIASASLAVAVQPSSDQGKCYYCPFDLKHINMNTGMTSVQNFSFLKPCRPSEGRMPLGISFHKSRIALVH